MPNKPTLTQRHFGQIIAYLFFGVLTTVVNICAYFMFLNVVGLNWQISNVGAWILSVLFAFVTNKLWVFKSMTPTKVKLLFEFCKFIFARLLSLALDMAVMWFMLDLLHSGSLTAKAVTQVAVVVANYILSKLFIFTNHQHDDVDK